MPFAQSRFGLEGKSAVVTSAARGIGRSVADALAGCGAAIVVSDRDSAGCAEVADAINSSGSDARALVMDIGDQKAIEAGFGRPRT